MVPSLTARRRTPIVRAAADRCQLLHPDGPPRSVDDASCIFDDATPDTPSRPDCAVHPRVGGSSECDEDPQGARTVPAVAACVATQRRVTSARPGLGVATADVAVQPGEPALGAFDGSIRRGPQRRGVRGSVLIDRQGVAGVVDSGTEVGVVELPGFVEAVDDLVPATVAGSIRCGGSARVRCGTPWSPGPECRGVVAGCAGRPGARRPGYRRRHRRRPRPAGSPSRLGWAPTSRRPRRGEPVGRSRALAAGDPFGDRRSYTHPVLAELTRQVPDRLGDASRPTLAAYAPRTTSCPARSACRPT